MAQFEAQTIDDATQIGYGLALGDVDGDGKVDVLLADKKEIVWYRNPDWRKSVIARDLTSLDNVCIAARDLNGDGKVEVAVGAMWNPGETINPEKSGSIHYLMRPDDGKGLWREVRLPHDPTVHRMHWVRRDNGFSLAVAPLHGRGNQGGKGKPVRIRAYAIPENPEQATDWQIATIDESLHKTHNFDVKPDESILVGGTEGVNLNGKPVITAANGCRGVGEVRAAGRSIITIEPMHGNEVVWYEPKANGKSWERTVLDNQLFQGHALAAGDVLDNGGRPEVVAGWRSRNKAGKMGIRLYTHAPDKGWSKQWIDEGGMATEDLKLVDLNQDGRLDIVAAGRSTKNVKIYWNRIPAP